MALNFRIKICGLQRHEDVATCLAEGVDAIGINFCASSPRRMDIESAMKLVENVPSTLQRIGVFANPTGELVKEYAELLRLDAIQLHGDEAPHILSDFPQIPLIKAFRVAPEALPSCRQQLEKWIQTAGDQLAGILLDAAAGGQLGGTGQRIPAEIAREARGWVHHVPVILAGGLNPATVYQAICDVRPDAVDCASGVEQRPGIKDPLRIMQFVAAAKKGWNDVETLAKRG